MDTALNTSVISPAIQAKVDTWLTGNFDQATKDEILALQKNNPAELADAFLS